MAPTRRKGGKSTAKSHTAVAAAAASANVSHENHQGEGNDEGEAVVASGGDVDVGKDGDAAVPVCVYQQPDYLFEMFFLVFFVLYLLLQNYNIHHGAIERYNMSFIAFTAVFFTKRVTWRFMDSAWASGLDSLPGKLFRLVLTLIPSLWLLKSGAELAFQHDPPTLLYLMYPYVLYVSLFGASGVDDLRKYTPEELAADPAAGIMLGFRQQLKHVVYGSLEAGYFVGMLPLRFLVDRHAVYDHRTGIMLVFYGVVNAGVLLSSNLVSNRFVDFREQARTIGSWKEIRSAGGGVQPWSHTNEYKRGEHVRHKSKLYVAEGPTGNRSEPDDWVAWAFYRMFRHPRNLITNIVLVEVVIIVSQIVILCVVRKWQAVACWAVLITSSYLVLLYSLQVRRKVIRVARKAA